MVRVILLIDCASEFDRKLLRGMIRYSRENGPWLFYRMPSGFKWGEDREELKGNVLENLYSVLGREESVRKGI